MNGFSIKEEMHCTWMNLNRFFHLKFPYIFFGYLIHNEEENVVFISEVFHGRKINFHILKQ